MFTKIEDVVAYWQNKLNTDKATIGVGIKSVESYDKSLVVDYPSILIVPNPEEKRVHGTHTWQFAWDISVYIFHADLAANQMTRSIADVQLAQAVADYMEQDFTVEGNVNFGFIRQKLPFAMPSFVVNRSKAVVCTRLSWTATSQGRF